MRSRIDAVLVVRRGGEHLSQALEGLKEQTLPPQSVLVADLTGDRSVADEFSQGFESLPFPVETLVLASRTSFPLAIQGALDHLHPGEGTIESDRWLWLLRDDIVARPSALGYLAASVDGAPSIRVAGPKQRFSDRPGFLRELGETLTPMGQRVALAERELDQAQYDRLSDVLAVGEAGMLIHADTLRSTGGFDEALPGLDAGLDLCVRVRLQGHRIVVVPRAVVDVGSSSADWNAGKKLPGATHDYLSLRAWLYRRLVYTPLWAFLPLLLAMLPWSVIRAAGQLVAKRPDRMFSEVSAALAVLVQLPSVMSARKKLNDARTTSWEAIDALRMGCRDVAKKRAIAREEKWAQREEQEGAEPSPRALPQLPWLVLALVAVAGAVFGPWWGSTALIGGGALPLAATIQDAWAQAWSLIPTQWGFDASALPADPAALLFALLGSLNWWAPSSSVVNLFGVAIPLAGTIAWWGFSHLFRQSFVTTVSALLWALSPTFLVAISEGRIGAVMAHLALPWLVGSLLSAHQSWQRVGTASLAAVVVTASAPVLFPAVILGVVGLVIVRGWGKPLAMFTGVLPFVLIPSLLLAAPRFFFWWSQGNGAWWENWGILFADPGVPASYSLAPWWQMMLGIPSTLPSAGALDAGLATLAVMAGTGVLLVTAIASLALGKPRASAGFAGLFSLGLVTATSAPALFSGYEGGAPAFVWPGTGVSLLVLGVLIGAGSLLDRVVFQDAVGNFLSGGAQWWARGTVGVVVAASLVAPVLVGMQVWTHQSPVSPSQASRTVPAFVAAESALMPQVGTLVIEPAGEAYRVSLRRGAGDSLSSASTLVRAPSQGLSQSDEDLARLSAMLIRPSSATPLPLLQKYGIRFVFLQDASDSEAALSLSRQPGLVSASTVGQGQLWQAPEVTAPEASDQTTSLNLWNQLFLIAVAMVAILAIPTERRVRATSDIRDDALPTLGEETSDDV